MNRRARTYDGDALEAPLNVKKTWNYVLQGSEVQNLGDFLIHHIHEAGVMNDFVERVGSGFTSAQFWKIIAGEGAPDENLTNRFALVLGLDDKRKELLHTYADFWQRKKNVEIITFPEEHLTLPHADIAESIGRKKREEQPAHLRKLFTARQEFYDFMAEVTGGKVRNPEDFAAVLGVDVAFTEGLRRPRSKEIENIFHEDLIPEDRKQQFFELAGRFFGEVKSNPPVGNDEMSAIQLAKKHGGGYPMIERQLRALRKQSIVERMRDETLPEEVATTEVNTELFGWRKPAQGKEALYATPDGQDLWLKERQETTAPRVQQGEHSPAQLSELYKGSSPQTIDQQLRALRTRLIAEYDKKLEKVTADAEMDKDFIATVIVDKMIVGMRKPARGSEGMYATWLGEQLWQEEKEAKLRKSPRRSKKAKTEEEEAPETGRSPHELRKIYGGRYITIKKELEDVRKKLAGDFKEELGEEVAAAAVNKIFVEQRRSRNYEETLFATDVGEKVWWKEKLATLAPPEGEGELSAEKLKDMYVGNSPGINRELVEFRKNLIDTVTEQTAGRIEFDRNESAGIVDRYLAGERKPIRGPQTIHLTEEGHRLWADTYNRDKKIPRSK